MMVRSTTCRSSVGSRWPRLASSPAHRRGAILCLVFAEQPLELTQARHLGATKTEPALSEVASAVGRVFYGRDATCWQPYVKG